MKHLEIRRVVDKLESMRKRTWVDPIPTFAALAIAASIGLILMLLIGISDVFNAPAEFFLWLPLILAPSIIALLVVTLLRPALNVDPKKFYGITSVVFVALMLAGVFVFPDVSTMTYLFNCVVFIVMAGATTYTVLQQR